jgi:hypothetical protein
MQNTNRAADITLSDLKDLDSFKRWLKHHLSFYEDDKISNSHLLIYLDYIENIVMDSDIEDKNYWLKLFKDLESKLKTFKRVENKNEL